MIVCLFVLYITWCQIRDQNVSRATQITEPAQPKLERLQKELGIVFNRCQFERKREKIQVAALLRVAGQAAQQWFEKFSFKNADAKDKLECVLDKFQEYCEPKKNITVVRYLFNSRDQKAG